MVELIDYTFIVKDNSIKEDIKKSWACSRKALDSKDDEGVYASREGLEIFSLHNCSIQKGLDKFAQGNGVLENENYKLTIDNIFYGNKEGLVLKRVSFQKYLELLE